MAAQAVASAAWTYIGKPIAIKATAKFIDGYFDRETAAYLKDMIGAGEDKTLQELEKIQHALAELKHFTEQTLWASTWGVHFHPLNALHSAIKDLEQRRTEFVNALAIHDGKNISDLTEEEIKQVEGFSIAYYKSCRQFIKLGGSIKTTREYLTSVTVTLPGLNKNILQYSAEILRRRLTDVFEYNQIMNEIFMTILQRYARAKYFFDEALTFYTSMKNVEFDGKPAPVATENPLLDTDVGIKAILENYAELVADSNVLAGRINQLVVDQQPISLRSARWPAQDRGSYNCYITACFDGTPLSTNWAVDTGKNHGKLITSFDIGRSEGRLTNGLPQIFPFSPASGKKFDIHEVWNFQGDWAGSIEAKLKLGKKRDALPEGIEWIDDDSFDYYSLVRIRGTACPPVSYGLGILSMDRKFEFRHTPDSQSWTLVRNAIEGEPNNIIRFRHDASGKYLAGMRNGMAYLTTDINETKWQIVLANAHTDVTDGSPASRICFILRSMQGERHALSCRFTNVAMEPLNYLEPGQHFHFFECPTPLLEISNDS